MITIIHPSIVQGSSFISNMICQYLILPGPLRETFDFVIGEEIDTNYLILHKGILGDDIPGFAGETQIGKCVRLIKLVCSPEAWFCRQLVYFMLSLVPLFGPVVIVLLKASRSGFMKHRRYFELKGLTLAQKNYLWCHKRHLYFSFGFWCTVSEMIPLLNIIFFYTNIIGAAMWAIDIEKLMNSNKESTEPDERAQSAPTTEYRTAEKSNRM